jgi:2-amino-4-hydroxy-6-hydroxymethyldihydropteridine diphosphokinase
MNETRSVPVVVALGANLGERIAALQLAVDTLRAMPDFEISAVSSIFETDPVGGPEQPEYANAVLLARTSLAPIELLHRLQGIEATSGRIRDVRWGPRTLDLDIIDFNGRVSDDPDLTLPHPRAHLRGFVIIPWLEVDPDAVLPGLGRIADLSVVASGVRASRGRLSLGSIT